MSTETNEQHLLRVFDACIAQATAPLTAQIDSLTKELAASNDKLRSVYEGIRALLPLLPPPSGMFRSLMQKIQANMNAGKITVEQVNAALVKTGLQPEDMALLIGDEARMKIINGYLDDILMSASPVEMHKGIPLKNYFAQGWTIEQLCADGYALPTPSMTITEGIDSGKLDWPPGSGKYHHSCNYCGERFEMIPQQIRHVRLGHKVYCNKHRYGRAENQSST